MAAPAAIGKHLVMDMRSLVAQAAHENACWCDLVCRAHGAPGEFHGSHWIAHGPVPPCYPRLVTLGGPERFATHRAAVGALVTAAADPVFAVKDSFRTLDGAALGLQLLFEAEWIALATEHPEPRDEGQVRWGEVRDEAALAAWEGAWRGTPPPGDRAAVRVFPAALLRDPRVVFLAGEREGRIVGTGVLHRSGSVIGLSNVTGDLAAAFRACSAASRTRFPGLPVVGYEHGPALDAARAAGFEPLAPLAVWERRGEGRGTGT